MYELTKSFFFEAGHILTHHNGHCKDPHGHSYQILVHIEGHELQQKGPQKNMIIDFYEISSLVQPMIDLYFDHKWLNDSLETDSPTAEFIASWIFNFLKPKLSSLTAITVYETTDAKVTYRP